MVKFWGKQLAFTRIVFLGLAFFATWCSLLSPQPAEHNQLLFNRSYTIATVLPRTCHALLCSPVHRHMLWKEQLHFIHVSLLHCHANKKKTRSMFTKTTMKNIDTQQSKRQQLLPSPPAHSLRGWESPGHPHPPSLHDALVFLGHSLESPSSQLPLSARTGAGTVYPPHHTRNTKQPPPATACPKPSASK